MLLIRIRGKGCWRGFGIFPRTKNARLLNLIYYFYKGTQHFYDKALENHFASPFHFEDFNFIHVSRGTKWLDYESWKTFLEELSWKKRLNHSFLIEKLVTSGKPLIKH